MTNTVISRFSPLMVLGPPAKGENPRNSDKIFIVLFTYNLNVYEPFPYLFLLSYKLFKTLFKVNLCTVQNFVT